jgi:phosphoadenosine phosphosulfate reductase
MRLRSVPYNPLLDQGYRSIGDLHSTAPPDASMVNGDVAERSGRWQGKKKSECGLHSNYWDMKKRFEERSAIPEAVEAVEAT